MNSRSVKLVALTRAAIVCTAVVGGLAFTGGVASAGSNIHTNGGVAGATNCVGQTEAFVAQGNFNTPGTVGIGNVASVFGVSVKQVQAGVQSYCATGIIP